MNRTMQMQYQSSQSTVPPPTTYSQSSTIDDSAKAKANEALQKLKGATAAAADRLKQAINNSKGRPVDNDGDDFTISAPSNFQHASHLDRNQGRDDDLFDQVEFAARDAVQDEPVHVTTFAEPYKP
jgi:hypothetical protein